MEIISISKIEYENLLNKNNLANELQSQVEILLKEKDELLTQIEILKEKILDLQKRLFGKKKDEVKKNKPKSIGKKSETNKGGKSGRKPIDKSQIDRTQYYDFAETPICNGCENAMLNIGSNDSYHEDYEVIIRKVKISKAKYICRDCNIIKVATGHRLAIRKGLPMPGFLAQIILDKFSNGLPFYRQAQMYGYFGHTYTRQMLNNWTAIASELLMPLYNLILLKMLQTKYLASDETNLTLLHAPNKETSGIAYVCVLKQFGEKFNFVYCWAINSRKQEEINNVLENFAGYLQTDGLNFYSKLEKIAGIILVKCWAHTRRKFVEVVNLSKNNKDGVAFHVVEKIDLLYKVEKQIKNDNLNIDEAFRLRQEKSKPILLELKKYLEENIKTTPPKSKLGKAIKYAINNWEGLNLYLTDGRLDIDNNHTERCIKYIVMGRKAWLFSDNIDSANKLAALYSLIISCKINNINPKTYLEYVLTQIPYINKDDVKELEQLLPDRFDVSKRFDQEFLEKQGIVEKIIDHDKDVVELNKINYDKVAKQVKSI